MRLTIVALMLALVALPAAAGLVRGQADCGGSCEETVVYLEGAGSKAAAGDASVVFDQKEKVFIPYLLPVLKGTTVQITNGDPFLHNVHIFRGKETVLNIALPFQGQVIPYTFSEPGIYAVSCDAHPEMSAFIAVLESPYFTTPGDDGTYELTEVPPGEYTVVVHDVKKGAMARSQVVVD